MVRTPRLVLRAWKPDDAERLQRAIVASRAHLQPWLEFARRPPETLATTRTNLAAIHRRCRRGELIFGIFDPGQRELLGTVAAHRRIGEGASELGYWIHVDHTHRGYATEAASALIRIEVQARGVRRMEIHTDPQNVASRAVAEGLGFAHQVTIRTCVLTANGPIRDNTIFALEEDHLQRSPGLGLAIDAFDFTGRPVVLRSRRETIAHEQSKSAKRPTPPHRESDA